MTVSHKYCSRSSDVLPWKWSWFLQFDLVHICNRVCAERWGNPVPPEPLLQPQENHREASWRWASAPLTPLPGAREQWAKHRDACWTTTWSPEANVWTEGDWVCFEVCVYILYFSLDHMDNINIFWLLLRKWHQWTIFGCQNKWNCAIRVGVKIEVWFGVAVVLLNFDHVLDDKTNMNGAWLKTSSVLYSYYSFVIFF